MALEKLRIESIVQMQRNHYNEQVRRGQERGATQPRLNVIKSIIV